MNHPGFKAVQEKIAHEKGANGKAYGEKIAGAILAKKTREAGKGARKKNPHLNRVKGHYDMATNTYK